MRYAIIKTTKRTVIMIEFADHQTALRAAGLTPGATDTGTVRLASPVRDGISLVVSEFGLFVPPEQQSYFALEGYPHLCAGNAVLYGFDERGRTVNVPDIPHITWLPDRAAVEHAIVTGRIERPSIGVNGNDIWHWPDPRPSEDERRRLVTLAPDQTMIIDGDTTITTLPDKNKMS